MSGLISSQFRHHQSVWVVLQCNCTLSEIPGHFFDPIVWSLSHDQIPVTLTWISIHFDSNLVEGLDAFDAYASSKNFFEFWLVNQLHVSKRMRVLPVIYMHASWSLCKRSSRSGGLRDLQNSLAVSIWRKMYRLNLCSLWLYEDDSSRVYRQYSDSRI